MFTIRQVLRLYASGMGTKSISQSTGIARNTIKKYLYRYLLSEKTMAQIEKMSDAEMSRLFLIKEPIKMINKRVSDLQPMLPEYASMLKKRGVTKANVFEVYAAKYPDGFRSSAFIVRLNHYMQLRKSSLKMTHIAGDKMFVDFTGQKLHLVDADTGEINDLEVFVAIPRCCQLTFVMAVHSQCKEDFILGCERALHFFGGVPQAIVPDNLKSAVTKASKYAAQLNAAFAAFAEHYHTFGYPTRTYRFEDKVLVESTVKISYTAIFSKIDQKVYHQLDEINKDILVHLEVHNNAKLTGESYSRIQLFTEIEKQTLQQLDPYLFEPITVQLPTVNKYGHVVLSVDKRYYSVPYKLIGKRLKIKYTTKQLHVSTLSKLNSL